MELRIARVTAGHRPPIVSSAPYRSLGGPPRYRSGYRHNAQVSTATPRRPTDTAGPGEQPGRSLGTVWQLVTVAVIAASLVAQTWLVIIGRTDVNSGASTALLPRATRLVNLFSYFTIQSNILVLIGGIRLLIDPALRRTAWRVVRLDGLLGIVITGLVYVVVLRPASGPSGIFAWVNAGLHYLAPVLTLVGWLLFGPRPRITARVIGLALIWPLAWVGYTLIRGLITGWYPYPFLDLHELGTALVLRNLGFVVVLTAVLLALLKVADRLPALGAPTPHSDR